MAFQMKSCNIAMVYHIYKQRIVLPTWCFGFANKQIPFSERQEQYLRGVGELPQGTPICFLLNVRESRILSSAGTSLAASFPLHAAWWAGAGDGLSLCFCDCSPLGSKTLATLKTSPWEAGTAESRMWYLGRVMQPDVFYYSSEQHQVKCLRWFFSSL